MNNHREFHTTWCAIDKPPVNRCTCPVLNKPKLESEEKMSEPIVNAEVINETIAQQTGLSGDWQNDETLECPKCHESNWTFVHDDGRTCYCIGCSTEYDISDGEILDGTADENDGGVSEYDEFLTKQEQEELKKREPTLYDRYRAAVDAKDKVIPSTLPGFTPSQQNFTQTKQEFWSAKCFHYPTQMIDGDTWGVWVGKKEDVKDKASEFDVVMNLTFASIRPQHIIPIPELNRWENHATFQELQMDWPDFGVVNLPIEFWIDLTEYLEEHKAKLLVFCIGGHGRTGTALAALAIVSLAMSAREAIAWVRKDYCTQAIESIAQENYLESLYKQFKAKQENGQENTEQV